MHDGILILASVWFISAHIWAATSDAVQMRIPNALVLYLLAGFAVTAALSPPDLAEIAGRSAVCAAILAGGMILFARGWMGGGDVKLLAVTALWLGPAATSGFLLLTAMAGGVLTLAVVAHHARAQRMGDAHTPADRLPPRVPYGIAIAAAALATVFLRPGALVTG
ncbi:A24 family peptidase [Roseovarius sp. D0-M9]|uniref:A24 family peptidase n=1 Tax=Roseovarius sp. D0-M9 TaxID=3127117 RepID=UPI00300FB28A